MFSFTGVWAVLNAHRHHFSCDWTIYMEDGAWCDKGLTPDIQNVIFFYLKCFQLCIRILWHSNLIKFVLYSERILSFSTSSSIWKKKINVHNNIALSWSGLINGALFLPKRSWAFFSDESKQFLSSSNVTEGVKKVTNICLTHGMSEIKKYM